MKDLPKRNHRVVLASRPVGTPTPQNFAFEDIPLPEPGAGELLLRTLFLSLDPYMRGRMNDAKSYAAPVPVGGVMTGGTVCEVVAAAHGGHIAVGDVVLAQSGWQEYAVAREADVTVLDPSYAPLSTALGVLGMPGLTAYAGLVEIGKPQPGETVVVAAATGPVGSLVGQLAKRHGARAVGIAGGPEKCAYARTHFGFDACIDHRAADFVEQLHAAVPSGIDVYFENVGGAVLEAVVPRLNPFARVPVCGIISWYNATSFPGPDRMPMLMRAILSNRITVRGFIVWDFSHLRDRFLLEVGPAVRDHHIVYREDVVDGLDNAPDALIGLLEGRNFGKVVVRVDHGTR
jgi:NADPH-dependent curcumin reductase CurA